MPLVVFFWESLRGTSGAAAALAVAGSVWENEKVVRMCRMSRTGRRNGLEMVRAEAEHRVAPLGKV